MATNRMALYFADWILVTANQRFLAQPEIVNAAFPRLCERREIVDGQLQQCVPAAQVAEQVEKPHISIETGLPG